MTLGVHHDPRITDESSEDPGLGLGLRYVSSRIGHKGKADRARIDMPLNLGVEHKIKASVLLQRICRRMHIAKLATAARRRRRTIVVCKRVHGIKCAFYRPGFFEVEERCAVSVAPRRRSVPPYCPEGGFRLPNSSSRPAAAQDAFAEHFEKDFKHGIHHADSKWPDSACTPYLVSERLRPVIMKRCRTEPTRPATRSGTGSPSTTRVNERSPNDSALNLMSCALSNE